MLVFSVLVTIIFVVFTLRVLQIYKQIAKNRRIVRRIPAPPEKFLTGHAYIMMQNPDRLFTTIREISNKYYPIFRLSNFHINVVSFLDPRDIEIVLSSTKHLSKSIIYTYLHNWLGTGLLTSSGSKWHKRRKILTPAFHFNILQQFIQIFNDETAKLVETLSQENEKNLNVVPYVTHFTLQSIAETAMGLENIDATRQLTYKEAIYKMGKVLLERLSKPWFRSKLIYSFSNLFQEEKKLVNILHDFSERIIRDREIEMVEADNPLERYSRKKRLAMLDLLLSAKRQGADIDYEGIREEVDTFMFEGHDTTAMGISFLLLVLANLEDIQEQVLKEILTVVGPTKPPTYEDLQELKFTERCIKEALRLFPSVPFISRFAGEDFTTSTGYRIPKGTILHIHIFDIHRNSNNYPDPLKFDPDRFLPKNVAKRHPFVYIPFSAGPRNCIGQKFAVLEIKTVLCGILRRFQLKKITDMYDIGFRPDLVLRPLESITLKIIDRQL